MLQWAILLIQVLYFFIFCVQALRHCETYMGKKLIMNWYTGAKVKLGQTDDSNYQDEEAADPEVEVSYTQRDSDRAQITCISDYWAL